MRPFAGLFEMWWIFPVLGMAFLLVVILLVVRPVALGIAELLLGWSRPKTHNAPPESPEEVLRLRYARGEINQAQYHEALIDMLKDRYIRGELTTTEFEARLRTLLTSPTVNANQNDTSANEQYNRIS